MSNIRTLVYMQEDFWGRPVYKCKENGILWKDITLGRDKPDLYSCGNEFDGEPDSPIKNTLEVHFENLPKKISEAEKFNYQLLGRLKSDCDYYLGYGNRYKGRLWAGDEHEQIDKMKELYNSFKEDDKPEWLTYKQILDYEKLMIISTI